MGCNTGCVCIRSQHDITRGNNHWPARSVLNASETRNAIRIQFQSADKILNEFDDRIISLSSAGEAGVAADLGNWTDLSCCGRPKLRSREIDRIM